MEIQTLTRDNPVIGRSGAIKLYGPAGFEGMRAAGRCAAEILDALVPHVVPGVTTQEIDDIVFAEMRRRGAVPATLGYRGYTKSCCTSINHVVCHGIPSDRVLKDGDIVNIDVTPIFDGWHGDTEPHVPGRRRRHQGAQAGRHHLRMPDARHGGGAARQHLGDIGAAIQRTRRAAAIRWCAISAATASARLPRRPKVVHAAKAGPVRS
jgi:methionyl aminopeptidase